jgi:hypothetical protein
MAGKRFTRFIGRDDQQVPGPMETDDDMRRAMARIESYGAAARPLDRRKPADTQVHPLGKVISLWPR